VQENVLFHPMLLLLGAGVNWAFTTGDLFNLFVSFEVMLLASYVLICHGDNASQLRESTKFVILNILASTFFLISVVLLYGLYGSLNMADLAIRLHSHGSDPVALAVGTLLLIAFGMKAALFPVFFWLPDAYPKAPLAILPYFAGLLTKVGIYCLYRVFTVIFAPSMDDWFQPVMLALAGGSMIIGVMGALSRWTIRHILSFHIVSQIGYMLLGLAIFSPFGIAAGIFFILHQIPVKAALFMVGGVISRRHGSDHLKSPESKGLMHSEPLLALLFMLAALSLAGIPPLSGFYGKYGLIYESIAQQWYFYAVIALVTSLFTLMSMVKIWRYHFWGDPPQTEEAPRPVGGVRAATALLVGVTLLIALLSGPLMGLAERSANELIDPRNYVGAVLGERGVAAWEAASPARLSLNVASEPGDQP
jgi:multicomponent Na+:H+ antiporter subunit D